MLRLPREESGQWPRLTSTHAFWQALEEIAQFWDDSKDDYYQVDDPEQGGDAVMGNSEDEKLNLDSSGDSTSITPATTIAATDHPESDSYLRNSLQIPQSHQGRDETSLPRPALRQRRPHARGDARARCTRPARHRRPRLPLPQHSEAQLVVASGPDAPDNPRRPTAGLESPGSWIGAGGLQVGEEGAHRGAGDGSACQMPGEVSGVLGERGAGKGGAGGLLQGGGELFVASAKEGQGGEGRGGQEGWGRQVVGNEEEVGWGERWEHAA